MPIIDGYDDLDLGPKRLPFGLHRGVVITKCAYETGQGKNGAQFYALDVTVAHGDVSERVRVWIPADTAEWVSWSEAKRKSTKGQLTALGLAMSDVESEQARAAVIGRSVDVEVKQNGEYRNVYFREAAGMDSGVGLPAPTVTLEGAHVSQAATRAPETIIV